MPLSRMSLDEEIEFCAYPVCASNQDNRALNLVLLRWFFHIWRVLGRHSVVYFVESTDRTRNHSPGTIHVD